MPESFIVEDRSMAVALNSLMGVGVYRGKFI